MNISEKNVSRWGFQPGPISNLQLLLLCQPSTDPPSPSVATLFIEQESDTYEFILFVNYMNS